MAKLACRLGFHRWTAWGPTSVQRELMPGYWQRAQSRRCRHCGFTDSRWGE
jgi:hypothetical protein